MSVWLAAVRALVTSEARNFAISKVSDLIKQAKSSKNISLTRDDMKALEKEVGPLSAGNLSNFIERMRIILRDNHSEKLAVDDKFRAMEDDILRRFIQSFNNMADKAMYKNDDYDWQVVYHVKEHGWLSATEKFSNDRIDKVRHQWVDIIQLIDEVHTRSIVEPPITYNSDDDEIVRHEAFKKIAGDNYELYKLKREAMKTIRSKAEVMISVAADALVVVSEQAIIEWTKNRVNHSRASSWKDIALKALLK